MSHLEEVLRKLFPLESWKTLIGRSFLALPKTEMFRLVQAEGLEAYTSFEFAGTITGMRFDSGELELLVGVSECELGKIMHLLLTDTGLEVIIEVKRWRNGYGYMPVAVQLS